jgi:hypothetical protein
MLLFLKGVRNRGESSWGNEPNYYPPFNVQLKNAWCWNFTLAYTLMKVLKKHRKAFTFLSLLFKDATNGIILTVDKGRTLLRTCPKCYFVIHKSHVE